MATVETITGEKALDIRFQCGDLDREVTLREYMQELLTTLFAEGESFSGKRPFGNSGWEHDVARALADAGAIRATYYGEGDERELDDYNTEDFYRVIDGAIAAL